MKKLNLYILTTLSIFLFGSCSGIRYMSIETREPAQVTLPGKINSILIVNNVIQQPDDIGHELKKIGQKVFERTTASSDSIAIIYTEALAQFLAEEDYFSNVKYYNQPIRQDNDFWRENALNPDDMIRLRVENSADAIISLDKLIMRTSSTDHFYQEGYKYGDMTGHVESIIRVYLPSLDGRIPAIQFKDSLVWEGYDIQDGRAYADLMLPTREEALKELAIYSAEKMTYVFSPHWEYQDRWLYTPANSRMREGEKYANNNNWKEAITIWENYYNYEKNKLNKAKAAHNIALGYEMLGEMGTALIWATRADDLMAESTSPNSLDRRRSSIYKTEILRRSDASNKLDMQIEQ